VRHFVRNPAAERNHPLQPDSAHRHLRVAVRCERRRAQRPQRPPRRRALVHSEMSASLARVAAVACSESRSATASVGPQTCSASASWACCTPAGTRSGNAAAPPPGHRRVRRPQPRPGLQVLHPPHQACLQPPAPPQHQEEGPARPSRREEPQAGARGPANATTSLTWMPRSPSESEL
jgi:hypothetical protein